MSLTAKPPGLVSQLFSRGGGSLTPDGTVYAERRSERLPVVEDSSYRAEQKRLSKPKLTKEERSAIVREAYRKSKLTKAERSAIGRRAAQVRWGKKG